MVVIFCVCVCKSIEKIYIYIYTDVEVATKKILLKSNSAAHEEANFSFPRRRGGAGGGTDFHLEKRRKGRRKK